MQLTGGHPRRSKRVGGWPRPVPGEIEKTVDVDVVVAAHVGHRVDDEQHLLDGDAAPHTAGGRRTIKQPLPGTAELG